ncbi:hypothetical protein [Bacillus sp. T3]|nr:hypothetical protein [Bacillus sp. T3]
MGCENILGHQELDYDWVELIIMALDMGYSKDEISAFLAGSQQNLES